MWDIPRLYVSACSNSVQLVPLHPIIISMLFHHYKELKECIAEVEEIRGDKKVNNNNNNNNHNNSSISGSGIIVMMTEQEKPLETYDEMVQEMEQEEEEEYRKRSEQEAAKMVDKEMQAELST